MRPIRKILTATDFSPCADEALAYALELARRFDATVTLMHVAQFPVYFGASEIPAMGSPDTLKAILDDASRALEERRHRAERPIVPLIVEGVPFVEILREARSGGYDLIVVGTRGRTGMKHVVFGSVAERVVRQAPCPVLTVHAEDGA